LDFDGGVDWYVPSYESYEAAFKDPYYLNVIEPDEWNFVDKGSGKEIAGAVSTVGVSRDIVREGKSCVGEAELSGEQRKLLGTG
jgi:EthD domain